MKKIDSSIQYEINEEKTEVIFHLRDKFFAPYGAMEIVKINFPEKEYEIKDLLKKEFNSIKNNTSSENYPINLKIEVKKDKIKITKK